MAVIIALAVTIGTSLLLSAAICRLLLGDWSFLTREYWRYWRR